MEPVRTCLGCRERDAASSLLRVVARDGEAVADPSATLSGRGAWVHPTLHCVDTAIARKAFGRALRTEIAHTEELRKTVDARSVAS
jgi:predicted RNA-binding protein YlxR (DUF448 family)